jgi:hypothetical protein
LRRAQSRRRRRQVGAGERGDVSPPITLSRVLLTSFCRVALCRERPQWRSGRAVASPGERGSRRADYKPRTRRRSVAAWRKPPVSLENKTAKPQPGDIVPWNTATSLPATRSPPHDNRQRAQFPENSLSHCVFAANKQMNGGLPRQSHKSAFIAAPAAGDRTCTSPWTKCDNTASGSRSRH